MGFEIEFTPAKIRHWYRRFIIGGYTKEEATNLVATAMGLSAGKRGWVLKELNEILFWKDRETKIDH